MAYPTNLPHKYSELTQRIIGSFFKVYNELGYGFLERVYENALAIELGKQGLEAVQEKPIAVYFSGQVVGEYLSDLVVADKVIVELKAHRSLLLEHEAQILNYLKATSYEVGLLLNFGPKPQVKRFTLENTRKEWWTRLNKTK